MKLRTKTIIFYSLLGSSVLFTGVGLGCLFGLARIHNVNFNEVKNNPTQYEIEHIGFVAGTIITTLAVASILGTIEFGLSYYFTWKFINARKEKLRKEAEQAGKTIANNNNNNYINKPAAMMMPNKTSTTSSMSSKTNEVKK